MKLEFNPIKHSYTIDEIQVPSITQVIGEVDPFKNFYSQESSEYGTYVHRRCADFLRDELLWDHLAKYPGVEADVYAFAKYFDDRYGIGNPNVLVEMPLGHPVHMYAGTFDFIVRTGKKIDIWDIKTGAYSSVREQLCRYQLVALKELAIQNKKDLYFLPIGEEGIFLKFEFSLHNIFIEGGKCRIIDHDDDVKNLTSWSEFLSILCYLRVKKSLDARFENEDRKN